MAYPNLKLSNLLPDNMFFLFDCGDIWMRNKVNFQDDLDICFKKVVLPSVLELDNDEIENFNWSMRYTAPYLKQIKGLKENQTYQIVEEKEITNKGEVENENHNENFINPINLHGKTLSIIEDIFLYSPDTLIKLVGKFKNIRNITFTTAKMTGGFLELTEDEDDYINKTLKNPDWWTCNMDIDDKNFIDDLKKIKAGINPSIKFDFSLFPDEDKKKLEKEIT